MDGDSLIYASGQVVVTRTDIVATSDSLFLDRALEHARFIREPVIKGKGKRPFTLSGGVIDLYSRNRKLERVLSRATARVVSDDLEITSDTLELRIADDLLQRSIAWGTKRARAVSPAQDMTADSIEIVMPNQQLREVRAIGKAEAFSDPDTTKIRSKEPDWLRGDTIIAVFDSIPAADTTTRPRIRELRSRVSAHAYYQIPPDSGSTCVKANYNRGHAIDVTFTNRTVRRVTVTAADSGVADGIYLECPSPAGDSSAVVPSVPPQRAAPPGSPPPGFPPPRSPPPTSEYALDRR
jgi:hypothetical protein